jgi:1-acylglycerone phosphate reductase
MEGLSPGIEKVKLDVLDDESIQQAVKGVVDKEGRIDVLVNNAGGNRVGAF